MIIANFAYGRLGNQLQLAAHLITFSLVENRKICLLYLNEHANAFPYFAKSPLRAFPAFGKNLHWLEKIYYRIYLKILRFNIIPSIDFLQKNEWVYFDSESATSSAELVRLKKSWLCTVKLWRLRSISQITKYKATIKNVFTPHEEILKRGQASIQSLGCEVVVGVHIRWGDYKTAVPDCYHDISVYRQRMLETQSLFNGKKVGFIVCTEEQVDLPELSDLNCVFPKASAIEDLYTLAQTDLLIASPSTFSEWAAYWGDICSYTVIDPDRPIRSMDDFVSVDLVIAE